MHTAYYVNPFEYLFDDEERWGFTGETPISDVMSSDESLSDLRESCRLLALTNEFAINAHENRISYIVGSGHTITVEAKPGCSVSSDVLQQAQRWLDDFAERNRWFERQQEIIRRKDRDVVIGGQAVRVEPVGIDKPLRREGRVIYGRLNGE